MRHVSRNHRVVLDWLFDRINLDSKIKNHIHRHQESTCRHLDQGAISHVMSGNHLLTLFNISHFSSTSCIAAMAKRAQQENQEKDVSQQNHDQ